MAASWVAPSKLSDLELHARLERQSKADPTVRELLVAVENAAEISLQMSKTILGTFPEYTLHDSVHQLRVGAIMGRLIPQRTLDSLGPLELAALLLVAVLHDIGMALSPDRIRLLLSDCSPDPPDQDWTNFRAYRDRQPDLLRRVAELKSSGRLEEVRQLEGYLLAGYLRANHASRSSELIYQRFTDRFRYSNFPFSARVAQVCASHTASSDSLEGLPCAELVGPGGERCNWRFVAILLRLADILDFDSARTPRILFEHLGVRDPISVREWRKHLSVTGWDIQPGKLEFAARCPDPVIEKAVREFVADIEREVRSCRLLLAGMHDPSIHGLRERYALDLPWEVEKRAIGPATGPQGPEYEFIDVRFELDRDRVTDLLFGLNLYGDRSLFIRELLQNARDAVLHLESQRRARGDGSPWTPRIEVRLCQSESSSTIEVEDNGTGMDGEILKNYFSRVGRSYYTSPEFVAQKRGLGLDFSPVSHFGVGILSAFMAGRELSLETKHSSPGSKALEVGITSNGALFWIRPSARQATGTKVSVSLEHPLKSLLLGSQKDSVSPGFQVVEKPSLFETVKRLFPHPPVPVFVVVNGTSVALPNEWVSFEGPSEFVNHILPVELNLAQYKNDGLSGRAVAYILVGEDGELEDSVELPDETTEEDGHELGARLQQEVGSIEHEEDDWSARGGETTSSNDVITTHGRWSQQGFAVSQSLFRSRAEYAYYSRPHGGVEVNFPFPVRFDINLEPPLVFDLTADRNRVVPSPASAEAGRRLERLMAIAFLGALGVDRVGRNAATLRAFAKRWDAQALRSLLEGTAK